MGEPVRSRILDYIETRPPVPPGADPAAEAEAAPRPSRILDYAETQPLPPLPPPSPPAPPTGANPPAPEAPAAPPAPKPGIPAYHTPVCVPAHPRYVDTTDADGRPARVPFIACELFEHPADGTVALAFSTPQRLVAALGEAQPWIAASIGPLAEGMRERGLTVRLDPRVAPGQRNWQPADLAAYAREVR
ncbi:SAV_915 family protein [Streptomyces sp. TS71-3]|uniref:SAV_915 family protein n=1 Tax=Streptomyces sp. TS71-3 TaxID=2733862 RepID=UPI0020175505|nr:SAV_915 family protein [Streptomyces sp. TS71-3]